MSKMVLWSKLDTALKALDLNEKQRFNIRNTIRKEMNSTNNNSFIEWLKAESQKDPDNMLPPSLDYESAIVFLKNYLLGEDWYVNYSGSAEQITTDIVYCILEKYSKKFRKELKRVKKEQYNDKKEI